MRIGVIGINHKLADLKLREVLAKAFQKRFSNSKLVHPGHSLVLLSTCNRTELYFSSEDLSNTHTYILSALREELKADFEQKLYSFFHKDCFSHLAKVTSGLDSAIMGETEIQGQVKAAYLGACMSQALEKELHFLFQKSLKIGKRIRTQIPIERGIPDLEHACLHMGKRFFQSAESQKVLFIGASDINLKIIRFFQTRGISDITLANRTESTAKALGAKFNLAILAWEKLSRWKEFDWIIFGTKAPEYVISFSEKEEKPLGRKLLIDLCVPRNVDPEIANDNIRLANIDEINSSLEARGKRLFDFAKEAEKSIDSLARAQVLIFKKKNLMRRMEERMRVVS